MATTATAVRRQSSRVSTSEFPDRPQQDKLITPLHILTTSPVQHRANNYYVRQLPLSLILLITSFVMATFSLDAPADLSRVTRSSKLLYYLNLPRLYESVELQSYPEVRYFNGRPEGFGAGSPFSMALEGLVSGKAANYVRKLRLVGMWKEMDTDLYEKGLVPDNTVLLNIAVKAAVDRMEKLQSFCWELNCTPLNTIYKGLAARTGLTSLTLKFPSNRIPRPTVTVPAMPGLTYLYISNVDPLCYPDDISVLLLNCQKLSELKLEWSPRMRREKEPSISLHSFFHKCMSEGVRLPVKSLSLKNMYARNNSELDQSLNPAYMESVALINCIEPVNPGTVFNDETWMRHRKDLNDYKKFKKFRVDRLEQRGTEGMAEYCSFEELYMVSWPPETSASPMVSSPEYTDGTANPANSPNATATPITSPVTQPSAATPTAQSIPPVVSSQIAKAPQFIAGITARHGPTLKKLLLSDRWCLEREVVISLLKACPQLEQLGLALDSNDFDLMRDVITWAPKLQALRILVRSDEPANEAITCAPMEGHLTAIGRETALPEYDRLRWLGIGPLCFELRGIVPLPSDDENGNENRGEGKGKGKQLFKRIVLPVSRDAVEHVEIFGLDTLDI